MRKDYTGSFTTFLRNQKLYNIETSTQVFSCEYLETFKKNLF